MHPTHINIVNVFNACRCSQYMLTHVDVVNVVDVVDTGRCYFQGLIFTNRFNSFNSPSIDSLSTQNVKILQNAYKINTKFYICPSENKKSIQNIRTSNSSAQAYKKFSSAKFLVTA